MNDGGYSIKSSRLPIKSAAYDVTSLSDLKDDVQILSGHAMADAVALFGKVKNAAEKIEAVMADALDEITQDHPVRKI